MLSRLTATSLALLLFAGCGSSDDPVPTDDDTATIKSTAPPAKPLSRTQKEAATTDAPPVKEPTRTVSAGSTANPKPKALPGYFFEADLDAWVGKKWTEVPLFQYMREWPDGFDDDLRYVVFFGRTCEHCEAMFHEDFVMHPEIARKVTAIQVPSEVNVMTPENAWEMRETGHAFGELPMGCEWVLTTPLSIRLEKGVVTFVEEGDHKKCLGM